MLSQHPLCGTSIISSAVIRDATKFKLKRNTRYAGEEAFILDRTPSERSIVEALPINLPLSTKQ